MGGGSSWRGGGVLTVAKVTQGQAAGYAEYLEAKSEPDELGDYYLKDGDRVQAPGRWAAGADAVGLRSRPAGGWRGAAGADGGPPSG